MISSNTVNVLSWSEVIGNFCHLSRGIYSFNINLNRAGPLLPRYTILRLRENIPQRLKRILSNFNIVASPIFFFLYGFRNATNVRDNRKTSSRYLSPLNRPVSAVIANLVMKDVEQRASASSPIQRFFWKKYVDDVISAVSVNEVERLLSHLNSVGPSIQFTFNLNVHQNERCLPFLDLNVHRTDRANLETSIYRKLTHTPTNISLSTLTILFAIKSREGRF